MKSLNRFILFILLSPAIIFSGCKKENAVKGEVNKKYVYGAKPNVAALYQPEKHAITFSADNGGAIFGNNTRLLFERSAFTTASGAIVTGDVQIEFKEVYTKSQMVLSNILPMSPQGVLESRGEAYFNVTQNGQQLRIRPGYASIQFAARSFSEPMNLFRGAQAADGSVSWNQVSTAPVNASLNCYNDSFLPPPIVVGSANPNQAVCDSLYTFPLDSVGWINCDYFVNGIYSNLTPVTVNSSAAGAIDSNTTACLVFSGLNVAAKFQLGSNGSLILGGSYVVPVGMQATIVALKYHNGNWYSCFKPITITANHTETLTLTPTTIADYEAAVKQL